MKIAVFVMSIMVMCICPGRISEEKDLVLREQRRPKDCRSPKGNHGSVRTDGCIQSTCTNGKWKPKMRTDICCYKQQAHKTNTALDTIVGADNCSSTTIGCGAVGQLEFSHKNCDDPATKQQVEKLENKVEDLSDKVSRKLENQAEKIEELTKNQAEKIEELTKSQAEKIEELTKSQAEKIEDLTNNMESLTQMVRDNIGDQAEMSLQMMKTLTNLTQLMVKHSDDTPMVEGVLITGGHGAYTTTELFLPHTGKTCILQPLPDNRAYHSLDVVSDKIILCGGGSGSSRTSCLQFLTTSSTGSWAYYATLAQGRYGHTTHSFQEDLLLMGGEVSKGTTEIIGQGTQYNLQQETRYACSIPDGSSTILTGGHGSGYLKTVARYNMKGFVVNLPDLATARRLHGCGSYVNTGNTKVLVVAGGHNRGYLSSTELLVYGATAWTSGESLPRTLGWAGSVNMGSYILLIGGYNGGNLGEILKFDGTWTEVGMMNPARHAASATKIELTGGFLNITGCY